MPKCKDFLHFGIFVCTPIKNCKYMIFRKSDMVIMKVLPLRKYLMKNTVRGGNKSWIPSVYLLH